MKLIPFLVFVLITAGCESTSSTLVDSPQTGGPKVAVLPLDGEYGDQASDLISEQLMRNGIATIERARIGALLTEHGYRNNPRFDQASLPEFGKLLGVKKLFLGTVTTRAGRSIVLST